MIRRNEIDSRACVRRSGFQWLPRATGQTASARRQVLGARLFLSGLALIVAAGIWRPAFTLAQLPAGTPSYNVNSKWVTDRGSQVYNVKAYGATGNGTTDDTAAVNATIAAAGVGGTVLFPPGNYVISSQIQQGAGAARQTVWGYGARITCNLAGAANCWYVGTSSTAMIPIGVSVYGLRMAGGPNTAQNSAFQVTGFRTHFVDVGGACNYNSSASACYTFGHFIENDNDQAMTIDHLIDMAPQVQPGIGGSQGWINPIITCTASYCGSALWGSGLNGGAGITYLHDSDLSMDCGGNPIDWANGNGLTVSNTILQAWSQFGVRTTYSSDFYGGIHWERGSCVNPLNDGNGHALGGAGLIALGADVLSEGSVPAGATGMNFATSASGGTTTYDYYVVGHASSTATAPLLIGYLNNGASTASSSAENFLVWPALGTTGVTTFDILRVPAQTIPSVNTSGNWAVATGLAVGTYCTASSGLVCAYTDSVGSPSSYTVASPSLYPIDTFWPGNLVLFSSTGSGQVSSYSGPAVGALVVDAAPSDTSEIHLAYTAGSSVDYTSDPQPFGPGRTCIAGTWNTNGGGTQALCASTTFVSDLSFVNPFVFHGLSFSITNPSGLTTSQVAYLTVPFACTLKGYSLNIDQGTITVKFWKVATGTAVPTSGNSISTNGESISTGTAIDSTTLTDFTTTTVNAYDHMAMAITAVSSATQVNGVLNCQGVQ